MGNTRQWLFYAVLLIITITPVFADDNWVVVETDKTVYHTGDLLGISGYILERKMPVIAMSIYDPDGIILTANNVELEDDDSFSRTISLDAPFYEKSGIYTIDLNYGKKTEHLTFEVESQNLQPVQIPTPDLIPEVIFLTTDKDTYQNNDMITISGAVSDIGDPTILVGIYDPNSMPAGFYTPKIGSNLEFSVSFPVKAGINFKTAGLYSIKAHYGTSNMTVSFAYADNTKPSNSVPVKEVEHISSNAVQSSQASIVSKNEPINPKTEDTQSETTPPESNPKHVVEESKPSESTNDNYNNNSDNLSVEDKELGIMLNEIMLNCDSDYYRDSIIYYDGMGPALMRLCNYNQALSYFDQSLIKNPDDVGIITNKGTAVGKLGDLDSAIAYYNMALDIDPTFLPALNNKANALAEKGDIENAIEIYNSVLRQDPSYTIAQNNLQKARDNLDLHSPDNKVDLIDTDYPILTESVELRSANESTDAGDIHAPNIFEQISVAFTSFFSFLK